MDAQSYSSLLAALDTPVRDRGYTSPETRLLLLAIAANFRAPRILELGTYTGKTAQALALVGVVDTVDPEPHPTAEELLEGLPARMHRTSAQEFLAAVREPYDLIYVDVDAQDFDALCSLLPAALAEEGVLVFHDVELFDLWEGLLRHFPPEEWEGITLPAWPTPGETHELGLALFRRRSEPWKPPRKRKRKRKLPEEGNDASGGD